MSQQHQGNMIPEITFEEHDGINNAKRVNVVSGTITSTSTVFIGTPTLFAVVNTAAAGQASVVLDNSIARIGFATVNVANAQANTGNVTLNPSPNFVGIVTIANAVGNATLNPSPNFIGLTTTTLGASPAFVGIVTIANTNIRAIAGNVTLSDAKTYIGLVTIGGGLSNVTALGNLTLSDSKGFIGLVTAVTKNGGTTKTLIPLNVSFAQASVATIAVPSATFNMTSLILNSNATVGIRIKSGVTYLIGNVSLSVMLNPGGGWVQHGAVDSPVYKGLAAAAAIVLEKEDVGQVAEIAGHLLYFDE